MKMYITCLFFHQAQDFYDLTCTTVQFSSPKKLNTVHLYICKFPPPNFRLSLMMRQRVKEQRAFYRRDEARIIRLLLLNGPPKVHITRLNICSSAKMRVCLRGGSPLHAQNVSAWMCKSFPTHVPKTEVNVSVITPTLPLCAVLRIASVRSGQMDGVVHT